MTDRVIIDELRSYDSILKCAYGYPKFFDFRDCIYFILAWFSSSIKNKNESIEVVFLLQLILDEVLSILTHQHYLSKNFLIQIFQKKYIIFTRIINCFPE